MANRTTGRNASLITSTNRTQLSNAASLLPTENIAIHLVESLYHELARCIYMVCIYMLYTAKRIIRPLATS